MLHVKCMDATVGKPSILAVKPLLLGQSCEAGIHSQTYR